MPIITRLSVGGCVPRRVIHNQRVAGVIMQKAHYLLAVAAACSLASTQVAFGAQQQKWVGGSAARVGSGMVYYSRPVGEISGRVTSGKGTPLSAAHIDITDHSTGQSFSTLTREDGRYDVFGLILGHEYDVLIRDIGYAPLHRVVDMPSTPSNSSDPVVDPIIDAVLLPIDVPPESQYHSHRTTASMGGGQ
jgi:hypothetical protein